MDTDQNCLDQNFEWFVVVGLLEEAEEMDVLSLGTDRTLIIQEFERVEVGASLD